MRASSARHRVDLAHDHRRPGPAGPLGHAAAGGAVAEHDHRAPGEEHVGRAQDAVQGRLAGAEAVVEGALAERLVDREHRAAQGSLGRHRAQAHEPGRRLLGGADERVVGVHGADQVGPVVEGDGGRARGQLGDVRRVGLRALPVRGEHVDAVVGQRRDDVVLGRERVGRAQRDLGPARPQRPDQDRGLGRDVQARAHEPAVERPVGREAVPDRADDGHLPRRPLDARAL